MTNDDVPTGWLKFERAEQLPNDGEAHTCDTWYTGINTSCPNDATHVMVYSVQGEVANAGSEQSVRRCDDCGRPNEVPV